MNADDLKKLTTESLKELAALLEQGRSERLVTLLKTMGRFHRYSLHNVCLIVAQRPTATRVAGFHTWRSVGRFVRKGEKGIAILAPIVRRRREETPEDESQVVVGFRTAYVFDVEQTDGAPLPQAAEVTGDPGEHTAALKRAISARGISVEYADDLGGALGLSCGGRIRVLNSLSAGSEFSFGARVRARAVASVRRPSGVRRYTRTRSGSGCVRRRPSRWPGGHRSRS
jgi:hypothetical protein